jgi:hypothetical protein
MMDGFKEPAEEVNPEQTTSLFSLVIYAFLDPLLFLAARLPHLGHENLFPLADYDYSRNTTRKAFPVTAFHLYTPSITDIQVIQNLDVFQGAKRRHLFFGLMKTYRQSLSMYSAPFSHRMTERLRIFGLCDNHSYSSGCQFRISDKYQHDS